MVHHTRKQQADDKFDTISGTNGLLGAADGAFVLQKEKRTDKTAVLEISGRDQPDQRLYLMRDMARLTWQLERAETELWKAPSDSVLAAVAAMVSSGTTSWEGATDLVDALGLNLKVNMLTRRLNINAGRLLDEYNVLYESSRSHTGRKIRLTLKSEKASRQKFLDGDRRCSFLQIKVTLLCFVIASIAFVAQMPSG